MSYAAIESFTKAMQQAGFIAPKLTADGKVHRFAPSGRGDPDGWCILFETGAGAFGNWQDGSKHSFVPNLEGIDRDKARLLRQQAEEAKKRAEVEREQAQIGAAGQAQVIWDKATEVVAHPYLDKKKLPAHNIRHLGSTDALVIPLRDALGKIWTLQYIQRDGTKRFLPGGRKKACFWHFGEFTDGATVLVAEGWATAMSLYVATGCTVVAAMDAGNLEPVVAAIRHKYQRCNLVICGDDDRWKPDKGNPGKEKAQAVSTRFKVPYLLPQFPAELAAEKPTDFSDLYLMVDAEEVKKQVDAILRPPVRLPFLDLRKLQDNPIPEREWIVDGWLAKARHVTGLYGDGGGGKSLLTMQLGVAAATGGNWLGIPVKKTRVMAVYCEDEEDELQRRLENICATTGTDIADLHGQLGMTSRYGSGDNNLMNFMRDGRAEPTRFYNDIIEQALEFRPGLIILDALHDLFSGNENDRVQASRFVKGALGQMAIRSGAAVLLLAHPSVMGMESGTGGSTAWNNSFRARWHFKRRKNAWEEEFDPENAVTELRRVKSNYSRVGDKIEVRWQNGVFVPIAPKCMGTIERIEHNNQVKKVIECLRNLADAGKTVKLTATTAHRAFTAPVMVARETGLKETIVARIIRDAVEQGDLEMRFITTDQRKQRESLVPAGYNSPEVD